MSLEAPIPAAKNWFTGEDKTLQFDITDDAEAPWPLAGHDLAWVLQRSSRSSSVLLERATPEIEIDALVPNRCRVRVGRSDTSGLAEGTYFHALACTDPGEFAVLSFGFVVLKRGPAT